MTVQQSKRRPLSRYLKDFKHSQTHCAHCNKLLDRITLVRRGEIVNKIAISRLDTLMDEAAWLEEQKEWVALCRFCGDLHCKEQSDFFDIIGFKQFLFEQTEMSHGTVREYVVRLRRLGQHLTVNNISRDLLKTGYLDEKSGAVAACDQHQQLPNCAAQVCAIQGTNAGCHKAESPRRNNF